MGMTAWKEYIYTDIADLFDEKRIPLTSTHRETRHGQYPNYGVSDVIDTFFANRACSKPGEAFD